MFLQKRPVERPNPPVCNRRVGSFFNQLNYRDSRPRSCQISGKHWPTSWDRFVYRHLFDMPILANTTRRDWRLVGRGAFRPVESASNRLWMYPTLIKSTLWLAGVPTTLSSRPGLDLHPVPNQRRAGVCAKRRTNQCADLAGPRLPGRTGSGFLHRHAHRRCHL